MSIRNVRPHHIFTIPRRVHTQTTFSFFRKAGGSFFRDETATEDALFRPVLIFCVFENEESAKSFFDYLNKRHVNIKFTMETEVDQRLRTYDTLDLTFFVADPFSRRPFRTEGGLHLDTALEKA